MKHSIVSLALYAILLLVALVSQQSEAKKTIKSLIMPSENELSSEDNSISPSSSSMNDHVDISQLKAATEMQIRQIREDLSDQIKSQRLNEKDHLMTQKWLVDNINDLHRELKQTEMDFEHYVQVTKSILANNEHKLRLQQNSILSSMAPPSALGFMKPYNVASLRSILIANPQTVPWI